MLPVKPLLLSLLVLSEGAFAAEAIGSIDDPQARLEKLQKVAAKVPFVPYESSQRSLFKNGDAPPAVYTPKAKGRLDLTPYSGDWLPLRGSHFNAIPFQSLAVALTRSPGAFSHPELLADWVRTIGQNYLDGQWGEADASHPLTVVAKLNLFDEHLRKGKAGPFRMEEVIEPGVVLPKEGSLKERYFKATGHRGLRYFFEPGVPEWWGFCDRLAVTNLNRAAQAALADFDGAFCGNIPFARTDMEDALTFFHPLDDGWKRYGKNRGNLTESESVSAEQVAWEEITGNRPLDPATFLSLLEKQVRPGGRGLIFDESSSPTDPVYAYDGIWNRPIFEYTSEVAEKPVSPSELSPLLLARYGAWLAKELTLAEPRGLTEASDRTKSMAAEANTRYDAWLGSLYRERALETGFQSATELPPLPPSRHTEAAYREMVETFRRELKIFWGEVEELSDELENKKENAGIKLAVTRITVRFPRQRTVWNAQPPLFERTFHAVQLVGKTGATPLSWYAYLGDYPPDLAIVPQPLRSPNVDKLKVLLRQCVPVSELESAVIASGALTKETAAPTLKKIFTTCAVRYLAKDAVREKWKGFPGWEEKGWDRAVKKCEARWPNTRMTASLNDPLGVEYTYR